MSRDNNKKRVVIFGASGSMGLACLHHISRDTIHLILLLRPSRKNFKLARQMGIRHPSAKNTFDSAENLEIRWGSITDYRCVKECVEKGDLIFNMAAIIPPRIFKNFRKMDETNLGGVLNIIRAIRETGGSETKRFINTSSVAVYGDRLPPYHIIKVGDPAYPSPLDFYGLTKMKAERALIESGLKYWAIIRQTFIALPDVFTLLAPLMFHQPLNQLIEGTYKDDAGIGAARLIDAPDSFYRQIYNFGNGPKFRVSYIEFLERMFGLIGVDLTKAMNRRWFTQRNFHCGYFADWEILNRYTNHAQTSFDDYIRIVDKRIPPVYRLAKFVPPVFMRMFLRFYAEPMKWICKKKKFPYHHAAYYFENAKEWKDLPDWSQPIEKPAFEEGKKVDTGFQIRFDKNYTLEDLKKAAEYRGGRLVSESFNGMHVMHSWYCGHCGQTFRATPMLILHGGQWCPCTVPGNWTYKQQAERDKVIAQLYYAQHGKTEPQPVYEREKSLKEWGFPVHEEITVTGDKK